MADEARELLHRFVTTATSEDLYGRGFMVYNIHSLLHITDDAKHFGSLNNCSCFPFENYLSSVKRLVRNGKSPLQQIAKRLKEKEFSYNSASIPSTEPSVKYPNNYYVNSETRECYEIVRRGKENYVTCRVYNPSKNFFVYPLPSLNVGIHLYQTQNSRMAMKQMDDIWKRAILLKLTKHKMVVQELLHCR
jgi:hypothetical protein